MVPAIAAIPRRPRIGANEFIMEGPVRPDAGCVGAGVTVTGVPGLGDGNVVPGEPTDPGAVVPAPEVEPPVVVVVPPEVPPFVEEVDSGRAAARSA